MFIYLTVFTRSRLSAAVRAGFGRAVLAESAHGARHVLVVSHGAAMRAFLHTVTGAEPAPLVNTALFLVDYGGGAFSIASE